MSLWQGDNHPSLGSNGEPLHTRQVVVLPDGTTITGNGEDLQVTPHVRDNKWVVQVESGSPVKVEKPVGGSVESR